MSKYLMSAQDKFDALVLIQKQLVEWAAFQPESHFKIHSSKAINQAEQLCKRLVSEAAVEALNEEAQMMGFYETDCLNSSLSISNIN